MTDTERIDELERIVLELQAAIGDYHNPIDLTHPPAELPNHEYPILFRQRQLGVGIDSLVQQVEAIAQHPTGSVQVPITENHVTGNLVVDGDLVVGRKLSIGMQPDEAYDAALQIGGNVAAEILGVSNTKGTDKQNPGEVHKNVISVAGNDGGLRFLQNLGWGPGGKIRTTLNRRASILALDSMGDVCKSTEEVGATSDGGQSWYIRTQGNVVEFCTYKVGAFIRILKSVATYGATDAEQL